MMIEQNEGLLNKINSTVEKALATLEDRIMNGDSTYFPAKYSKDGSLVSEEQTVKTPIKARDAAQIFTTLTHQRQLMMGQATSITQASTVEDQLKLLQQHFKAFAEGVVEGEVKLVSEEPKVSS
jgi:hypothetical protein